LVKRYQNDAGEPRTKWLVYLGEPPSFQLKKFIERVNKHPALEYFFPYTIESVKRYVLNLRNMRKEQRNQRIPPVETPPRALCRAQSGIARPPAQ